MIDFSYGIITVSDSCHKGEAIDKSGPKLKVLLQNYFNAFKITQSTVPDEQDEIEKVLLNYTDELKLNCIITTGGTGCSKRDVTPEATRKVIEREYPQLSMLMLYEGLKVTKFAALSRGVCGIRGESLIINFPGSTKACDECFEAIRELLPHAMELIVDMKDKTDQVHKMIQNVDVAAPKGADVKPATSSLQQSTVSSSESTPKPAKTVSKIKDFSELLKQSASSMDEAILSGSGSEMTSSRSSSVVSQESPVESPAPKKHSCPHKTANPGDKNDRNSPFPMINIPEAVELVFQNVKQVATPITFKSPMNCPPFRASLKDGYALKSLSSSKQFKVIASISAGDSIVKTDFGPDECYKINTGAPIPDFADCVVQIEDTKLISSLPDGTEQEIEVLKKPIFNLDVRKVGADLMQNEILLTTNGMMDVAEKTLLASVGLSLVQKMPKISIISTGDELVDPTFGELVEGKIYDSNTTMLKLLCQKYGFEVKTTKIAKDDYNSLKSIVQTVMTDCDVIISSGGVSMGDKDYVKPVLKDLGYNIHFGRVNVKPGKPMTFATNATKGTSFFGLPGNPVSAFVTFHIFVLPALRFMAGFTKVKSSLPVISVMLADTKYELDERPEFVRATVSFDAKNANFYAQITDNQMSSRIASLIHADVLLHLPSASEVTNGVIGKGKKLKASIIDQFFITNIV